MAQTHLSRLFQAAIEAQQALGKANDTISANMPTLSTFPETQVYIGLNDSETKKQEHDTGRYVSILKRVCVEHGTPFSFDVINGGYIHDDGEYTEENTIVLTFIDIERETVEDIARDLCTLFNQESVLMTTGLVQIQMIRPDSSANEK